MLELLLPARCLACGRGGAVVCASCLESLPRIRPPLCERCGRPTAWPVRRCSECSGRRLAFATARAAVAYDDSVRAIVTGWKEHGLRRLAATAADVVVAFARPARRRRAHVRPARPRTACSSAAITRPSASRASSAGAGICPSLALLSRTKPATRQAGATLVERRRNVRGAFTARTAPATVCLVDDVYTSGATASAAASALRKSGARTVTVVTFARALRLR